MRMYGDRDGTSFPNVPARLKSYIRCNVGSRYANVFPEPVWSAIMLVLPSATVRYDNAWIFDGRSKFRALVTGRSMADTPMSSNAFLLKKFDAAVVACDPSPAAVAWTRTWSA
jgi:hypothetical protein